MRAADEQILDDAHRWLMDGLTVWLCTIVEVVGASPRPKGALLALNDAGLVSGSISGGCVEDELLERLPKELPNGIRLQEFGLSAEENERLGLPCGGRLSILIQAIKPDQSELIEQLAVMLAAMRERRIVRRRVNLNTGDWRLSFPEQASGIQLQDDGLQQDFGPRFHLLLVGANELGRCLAELASSMDYQVFVCDPREHARRSWREAEFPLLDCMPDDAVRQYAGDEHSIVLTLTHDPRVDDMALMEALQRPLFYVGALGSVRTSEKRRTRLLALDLSATQIEALHAPMGLGIGSKTPMEIAIATMADLIQKRRALAKARD